tara:strand:- start:172 stop:402 length:231 start_codon:yes stop_codon:yes gene_type:complete
VPVKDEKNDFMKKLLDSVSEDIAKISGYGMKRSDAMSAKKCSKCGGDASEFKDKLSEKEYTLTAWCQKCQDNFFGA